MDNITLFKKEHVPWNKGKRLSGMKGKHHSEETKRKMSKVKKGRRTSCGMEGKRHSEESRRKISDGHKGQTPWNKSIPMFEKTKHKISIAKKGQLPWNTGKHRSEETKSKLRVARLKQIFPVKDTSIEVAIQDELKKRKLDFETHIPLLGKYQVDIFIQPNIVVECKGGYWHSKELKNGKVWEKDRRREQELEEAGYSIYSFWEHEIKASPESCVDKLLEGS